MLLAAAVAASAPAPAAPPPPADDAAILHVLGRVTFGPRPGDVERVRALGLSRYLEQQLDPRAPEDAGVQRELGALPTLTMSIAELQRQYPRPAPETRRPVRITAELQAARMLRAVAGERQLQEVMVDFWLNHFNVFTGKGEVRWYLTAYERDAIRPHALGRFGDLLRATAHHPAMLFYLDNWLSTRPDFVVRAGPNRGRRAGLNENYARELLELHTLGVDSGYTQQDVTEVARAFTGWSIDRPRDGARFVFRPAAHDPGAKTVLRRRLDAGGGQRDGDQVLDLLVAHPATARFLATKLVRRFVADDPPPGLVERVAAAYHDTGGDIAAMLRTIFASAEFLAPAAQAAKIKTPLEFVASAARALGASLDARGGLALARATAEIGQPLYGAQPPTGYPDRAEAWVNAGALLGRMNFALALTQRRLAGVTVAPAALVAGVDRRDPEAALDRLLAALLHDRATAQTRAVLAAQLHEPQIIRQTPDDRGPANTDVDTLAALVLGSPEFQRR